MTTHRPTHNGIITTPVGPKFVTRTGRSGARSGDHTHESLNPGRDPSGRPLVEPLIAPCGGVLGGPEDGRVTASRAYRLRDIPTGQTDAAIQTAIDYMQANGYDVSTRNLDQGVVWADAPDGTTKLVIQRTSRGNVTIGADSICVWPDGTPPPGRPI